MRVTKIVKEIREVERTEDVLCNRCGGSCYEPSPAAVPWPQRPERNCYGLLEAQVSGGYDSPQLRDATTYTFSLCERCLVELFDGFKHPPDESGGF